MPMGDRRAVAVRTTPQGRGPGGWALAAYHACDLVCWVAALNLLWIGCTLLGGGLLGAAPATVAAHTLARRRIRGETVPAVREFWRVWRAEFVRANVLLLPAGVVGGLLWLNWLRFGAAADAAGTAVAGVVLLAVGLTVAWYAVLVPLYVHYDLPLRAYPLVASRFVLANPGPAALLLVVAVGIAAVTAAVPGLLPFLSVGAWVHLDTALCLSFFDRNDELVTDERRGSR
jgi:uncharacterized membrane protein YesL